jgi:hypothetical protein
VGNNPVNLVDPTGHIPQINLDGGWGGAAEGKSCADYGTSGDVENFTAQCVGNGTGNYAFVQVTTFIPDEKFYEPLVGGGVGQGDGRDLYESGSHRTQQTVLVDLRQGTILNDVKDLSPSHGWAFGIPFTAAAPPKSDLQSYGGMLPDGTTLINVNANSASRVLKWTTLDISYSFDIYLAPGMAPKIQGNHDGFPAYEVSVYTAAGFYGIGYHPRENWQTLLSLGSPAEWYLQYPDPYSGYHCFGLATCSR